MPTFGSPFSGLANSRRRRHTKTAYKYRIIGGGMTAAAAVDGIREVDPTGTIRSDRRGGVYNGRTCIHKNKD